MTSRGGRDATADDADLLAELRDRLRYHWPVTPISAEAWAWWAPLELRWNDGPAVDAVLAVAEPLVLTHAARHPEAVIEPWIDIRRTLSPAGAGTALLTIWRRRRTYRDPAALAKAAHTWWERTELSRLRQGNDSVDGAAFARLLGDDLSGPQALRAGARWLVERGDPGPSQAGSADRQRPLS